MEKKFTLITGASIGLGKALAEECARRKMNLILVSLPNEQLENVGRAIRDQYGVEVHCYETDLTGQNAPKALSEWALANFRVDMLINNAGIGGSMPLEEASIGYIEAILLLNVRALCLLTYYFIPELRRHSKAYVLNVASLAAFSPVPYKTVYPASKAFVYSFSRSLRAELQNTQIGVTVIAPGPVLTNEDAIRRIQRYGFLGRFMALTPEAAARKSLGATLRGRALLVPGGMGKFGFFLIKALPYPLRLFILNRMLSHETKKEGVKVVTGV